MDIWVAYIFLSIMNNANINIMYKFLFKHIFSVLLDVYLGIECWVMR